ncbi:MAG: hypothetical protein EBY28_02650 [Betaproteobacteria bacterium]|nr:hypothetical protein [Betaproteobacteria bacterium]
MEPTDWLLRPIQSLVGLMSRCSAVSRHVTSCSSHRTGREEAPYTPQVMTCQLYRLCVVIGLLRPFRMILDLWTNTAAQDVAQEHRLYALT